LRYCLLDGKFARFKNKLMAETLGSLIDKLTIVKLKEYHSEDEARLISLKKQSGQLQDEINEYITNAAAGLIPLERMSFDANKVFKKEGNDVAEVSGNIAEVMGQLADVNCKLWHEQEKVYEFEVVAAEEKDKVVKNLALLNLERNKCIDKINHLFTEIIAKK
jgi:hypothetical protein